MNNLKKLEEIDFTGKVVAFSWTWKSICIWRIFLWWNKTSIYDVVVRKGAKVVGFTSTDGYHYEETEYHRRW